MDPNKNNTFEIDIRSPLREINRQNNSTPDQNNSPNKTMSLLDASVAFDNSILMPATDPENLGTPAVTSTNQENKRPRFSVLGTFDPCQKREFSDNEKTDSIDVDIRDLIDETVSNKPVSGVTDASLKHNIESREFVVTLVNDCVNKALANTEGRLNLPENDFNKSNISNVSSNGDCNELNNTVILRKPLIENKHDISGDNQNNDPNKTVSGSELDVNKETPVRIAPQIKIISDDLSNSFLEKFSTAVVISSPASNKVSRIDTTFSKEDPTEPDDSVYKSLTEVISIQCENNLLDSLQKSSEEFDIQDSDSIEFENPISQSEDFDTDSLCDEIESAQNEILHELSVESNKIVSELNKTQEIFKEDFSSKNIKDDENILVEIDSNKRKSLEILSQESPSLKDKSVKLEQKEQIIQEINVTYSEPISPNKLDYEEILTEKIDSERIEQISLEINNTNKELIPFNEVIHHEEVSTEIVKLSLENLGEIQQVTQEISTINKELFSPNKLHYEEFSIEAVKSPLENLEQKEEIKPKFTVLHHEEVSTEETKSSLVNLERKEEINAKYCEQLSSLKETSLTTCTKLPLEKIPSVSDEILLEINTKNSEPILCDQTEYHEEILTEIVDKNTPIKSINQNITFAKSPAIVTETEQQAESIETKTVDKNISFIIQSDLDITESPVNLNKIIKSDNIAIEPVLQVCNVLSEDIIVKSQQKSQINTEFIDEISAVPIVEAVISKISKTEEKHMSEANPTEKSEVCESAVTNSAQTNEMGEVIKQNDCFQKQSDITNGAVDNKESLDDAKNEMYNEMVERLSLLESDCEKYKIQVADLKRELKTCRQKWLSLESELADLKCKENELNILLDEFKNKKPESTGTEAKEEELKLLRASEEALKNEVIDLKVLVKQHENKLKDLQQKEVKLADDLSSKTQSELQISRVMEEYEKSISSLVAENQKMKKERDTAQMHLSNIELAFSDVHQKYERCKRIVQGYKDHEESYKQDIAMNRETIATQEQKYATLKAHAMAQLEKSNQELLGIKKQHETEMARLNAQVKRYEIKNDSLMEALQQKTKECAQLSAVCDEYIGNV